MLQPLLQNASVITTCRRTHPNPNWCLCSFLFSFEVIHHNISPQVDRSPTGSGVTARIALQFARKQIGLDQVRVFEQGLVGSKFLGRAVKETKCGDFDAVHVEVSGHAYYTGTCTFTLEKEDPFKQGFLLH